MKLKILLSPIILFVMSLLFQGCDILNNKAIKNVKDSRTVDYPDVTLGDTISYFATDAVWSGKMEVRQDGPSLFLVSVKGTFDLGKIYSDSDADSKAELVILFINVQTIFLWFDSWRNSYSFRRNRNSLDNINFIHYETKMGGKSERFYSRL